MGALSTIQHIFPPPRYITLPSTGIDISDTSLKYFQFERKRTKDTNLSIAHYGDIPVPQGVLERGSVLSIDGLSEALAQCKRETDAVYVRASLPEERAYLFETTFNKRTPHKEIRGLIESKLEENVPLSPRDALFDYQIIDLDEDVESLRVAVAVYAKDTIIKYYEACTKAGLMPLSFEIEAQALSRAVVPAHARATYMIVDFGKTRTGVGIIYNGTLMYASTIEVGGQELSAAMRTVLGDLPEHELTQIKNTQGLYADSRNKELYTAIIKYIQTIKEEVATRIQYWHTRDIDRAERQIEQVILCGGSANLAGLDQYLEDELHIPVVHASVWRNAFSLETYIPPITKRYSYGYATAIGLALADFIHKDV